jgi:hypothetical protein
MIVDVTATAGMTVGAAAARAGSVRGRLYLHLKSQIGVIVGREATVRQVVGSSAQDFCLDLYGVPSEAL